MNKRKVQQHSLFHAGGRMSSVSLQTASPAALHTTGRQANTSTSLFSSTCPRAGRKTRRFHLFFFVFYEFPQPRSLCYVFSSRQMFKIVVKLCYIATKRMLKDLPPVRDAFLLTAAACWSEEMELPSRCSR